MSAGVERAVREISAIRLDAAGRGERRPVAVPIEAPLAVQVNDAVVAYLMRLPGHDVELALGYCYTAGYITSAADVLAVDACEDSQGRVTVRTGRQVDPSPPEVLLSACVGPRGRPSGTLPEPLTPTASVVPAAVLLSFARRMQAEQETHRIAGAVHAAALFGLRGELVAVREDVGRHNAVDKVIGHCLYHGHNLGDCALASTGRASSEMVLKAAAARVPLALSRSGPTSLGVELADRLGITLVGYLRASRLTIYTHPKRIIGSQDV